MNIWEADKLIIFIGFVIPGFISIKIYELLNPSVTRDTSKQIIDAVAYSSINYALLFLPIIYVEKNDVIKDYPAVYGLFYLFVLFVCPIVMASLWSNIRKSNYIQKNLPHPTLKPWDYVFSKRKPHWIKVTLKDGSKIAGVFAENSFASSSPAEEQLYLEETWVINEDGGLERPKEQSEGIIVMASEIAYIELMKYGE